MAQVRLKIAKMRLKMAKIRPKMAKTKPKDGQDEAQDGQDEAQDGQDEIPDSQDDASYPRQGHFRRTSHAKWLFFHEHACIGSRKSAAGRGATRSAWTPSDLQFIRQLGHLGKLI